MWHEKYLGIPFKAGGRSFDGADCGGLVLLALQEERGVDALDTEERYSFTLREMARAKGRDEMSERIAFCARQWRRLGKDEAPRPFDCALYEWGGAACHCGLVVDAGHVLHVESGHAAHLEKLHIDGYRLRGIFRHEKLDD